MGVFLFGVWWVCGFVLFGLVGGWGLLGWSLLVGGVCGGVVCVFVGGCRWWWVVCDVGVKFGWP